MKNTKIEWADATLNPWSGCTKVSAGCAHCYAETLDKRWKGNHWGPAGNRKITSEANWKKPLLWNRQAAASGTRARVFCASMADVFEDHPAISKARRRLFDLIESTPHLIWMLLTKRPGRIMDTVPEGWQEKFPENVWMGTSIESQGVAHERIAHLLEVPSVIRFLSMEPLLSKVDLEQVFIDPDSKHITYNVLTGIPYDWDHELTRGEERLEETIHWVIAGGESGPKSRPLEAEWVRLIRDQCLAAGVPFFFKQWGGVHKKQAGHLLDGQQWQQLPGYEKEVTHA